MKYFFLVFCFFFQAAHSCSCKPLGQIDEKQYNQYDLIIKGKITKLIETKWTRIIYIDVYTYFKGKQKSTRLKIKSPRESGECGIFPKIGEHWLVFAYKSDNTYNTSLCTRTKNLNPRACDFKKDEIQDDLEFLERKVETTASSLIL